MRFSGEMAIAQGTKVVAAQDCVDRTSVWVVVAFPVHIESLLRTQIASTLFLLFLLFSTA